MGISAIRSRKFALNFVTRTKGSFRPLGDIKLLSMVVKRPGQSLPIPQGKTKPQKKMRLAGPILMGRIQQIIHNFSLFHHGEMGIGQLHQPGYAKIVA